MTLAGEKGELGLAALQEEGNVVYSARTHGFDVWDETRTLRN